MSVHADSPSPSRVLFSGASRRGGDAWCERSCSRGSHSRQRSRSRARSSRTRHDELDRGNRPSKHGSSRQPINKEKEKEKDRTRGRQRDRKYAQKMAMAQQVPMRMAMMQGMMGVAHPAMQMAMMQQMGMGHGMVPGMSGMQPMVADPRRKTPRGRRGGSSHSSSSRNSSGDSSSAKEGVPPPAAVMAAMAAMWPQAAASAAGKGSARTPSSQSLGADFTSAAASDDRLEAFLAANPVDPEAGDRLRALPTSLQQAVMRRGPVSDTRNPSAVLIARMRDAELGRSDPGFSDFSANAVVTSGTPAARSQHNPISDERVSRPARRSAKATIEAMIRDYRLSPGCAWMLRALPPDKQKLASCIDPAGQVDPSGYVAEQLKRIV